ncbi:MAG TPA: methytransferase partner Trm112 [Thermoplasmata archaeon]|nr:methytransferase partner Trm112 [Thermoplasmata archaeon]
MKADLMEILCCPVCRGDLTLTVGKKEGDEIVEGNLACAKCRVDYPIAEGIPDLLPPDERD